MGRGVHENGWSIITAFKKFCTEDIIFIIEINRPVEHRDQNFGSQKQ